MYEKAAIITPIWYRTKYNFTSMSNRWYMITIPYMNNITTFCSEISQQTLKIYEKIAIITQIWHIAKVYFTFIMVPWYRITVSKIKTIHPDIMAECARTKWQTPRLTDGQTDGLDHFLRGSGNGT